MQNDENKVKKSFFQGMKSELKKVVWPSARQTSKNTLVTIVFVIIISLILIVCNIVFDFISTKYYDLILGRNNNTATVNEVVSGEVISGEEVSGEAETAAETVVEEVAEPVQEVVEAE